MLCIIAIIDFDAGHYNDILAGISCRWCFSQNKSKSHVDAAATMTDRFSAQVDDECLIMPDKTYATLTYTIDDDNNVNKHVILLKC